MDLLLLALISLTAPDRPDRTPKIDGPIHQAMQGKWHFVSATLGDVTLTRSIPNQLFVTRTEISHLVFDRQSPGQSNQRFVIHERANPVQIDLLPTQLEDRVIEGIVKIEGDTLTICVPVGAAKARPSEFRVHPRSKVITLQFRREPPGRTVIEGSR